MQFLLRWLTSVLFALAVAACGGGEGSGTVPDGVLAGDPSAAAAPALPERDPTPAAPEDIEGDSALLTRLSAVLRADASVAQVNAAAREVGAGAISFSRTGSPFITLAVPRQPNAAALEALAAQLQAQPGILFASAARQADVLELPAADGTSARIDDLNHLLATRFPAAWNARRAAESGCGERAVTVIVPDLYFGKPSNFDEQMQDSVTFDPTAREPSGTQSAQSHGYRVAATLAAKYDSLLAHGANPSPPCLQIRLVDGKGLSLFEIVDKTITAVRRESGKVIVSSSVGYKNSFICGPNGNDECGVDDIAPAAESIRTLIRDHFAQGILWAGFAMQPAVVERLLLVQAGGNDADAVIGKRYAGLRSARLGSPFAIASTLADMAALAADAALWQPAPADAALPNLRLEAATIAALTQLLNGTVGNPVTDRNLVLVGATTNRPLTADVRRATLSNDGAALFAVGEDVSTVDFAVAKGTSFAAPQVAGLAAYLWLLEPTLATRPAADSAAALRATAHDSGALAGIVDAYAAVLSLDQPVALTATSARMRLALLDIDGDGDFDLADLQAFHDAYIDSGLVLDPSTPDYSRFDLNGDGYTGGSKTARMDLDPNGSMRFGAPVISEVFFELAGAETVFDERAVTDAQALCFYANTALYSGTDLAARDALLAPLCVTDGFESSGPEILLVGQTLPFRVTLNGLNFPVVWSVRAFVASVRPETIGRVDANGNFTAVGPGLALAVATTLQGKELFGILARVVGNNLGVGTTVATPGLNSGGQISEGQAEEWTREITQPTPGVARFSFRWTRPNRPSIVYEHFNQDSTHIQQIDDFELSYNFETGGGQILPGPANMPVRFVLSNGTEIVTRATFWKLF
jgi:subtilisin family serine protease